MSIPGAEGVAFGARAGTFRDRVHVWGWVARPLGRVPSPPSPPPRNLRQLTLPLPFLQTAFIGFLVQYALTHQGPIDALTTHLADPFGANIFTNLADNARFN